MELVSVLMSIYNENEIEIKMSMESLINQSYKELEILVIVDNPDIGLQEKKILENFKASDSRIKLFFNSKNIGLAMSMNYLASIAKGDYLLRMDADDVCRANRVTIQMQEIKLKKADLVCTTYLFIDEESKQIERSVNFFSQEEILNLLPKRNIIHHPTVLMKKECFDIIGGYRDFPCAQDYDLWLRFLTHNFKIVMIDNPLLLYRIRNNSVTANKRYTQILTQEFQKKSYEIRLLGQQDVFKKEEYEEYLLKNKALSLKHNLKFDRAYRKMTDAKEIYNKNRFLGGMKLVAATLSHKYYRNKLLYSGLLKKVYKES